ncbi:hypothetical protein [uncultured Flavobacterium sp.]|uniref:hypothetical protein n=1 Tax=uncultured Flavobacterium sp. TaxID=165435 RepID=UPI0025E84780|nr:hypothetical protein [uncultured Flavobacterium sp.]
MGNKKILVVSRSFYPENSPRSFRTTELVKQFARDGHDVTLITFKNDKEHVAFEKEHNVTIKDLGKLKYKAVDIEKGSKYVKAFKRVARRVLEMVFEYPGIELMHLVKKALKNESGYDLMVSIAVPHPVHWGVAAARSKSHPIAKTWIADCGDPYSGAGKKFLKEKSAYLQKKAINALKQADYITVPFDGAVNAYDESLRNKIVIIPQGFNIEGVDVFKGPVANPVTTLGYAGSFIPGRRDPRPFIDHLLSKGFEFKFVIYTRSHELFGAYKDIMGTKLEIKSYIPREELLFELSRMDFLVNFDNRNEIQLPSKLIDYALTTRPILNIDAYDINEKAVGEFFGGNYASALAVNAADYDIKTVAGKFIKLAEQR